MQLTILAFGVTRDIVGGSQIQFSLPERATVEQLKEQLVIRYPALDNLKSLLIAVNSEYSQSETILQETDEIALIPPVSGG